MKKQISYSPSDAARQIGVSRQTIDRWIRSGILHASKIRNRILIPYDEIITMLEEHQIKGGDSESRT